MTPCVLSLSARKRAEIKNSLAALPEELQAWRDLSEPGTVFEKHWSQIRRLSLQIEGLQRPIAAEFEELKADEALFRSARKLELRILAVQSIWDYFRSKFLLRTGGPFATFLRAADAFAWACYKPALEWFAPQDRALASPPLVALATVWSPNALPRDHAYEVARTPGGWTETSAFSRVIESLPVPIVGLPWSYLDRLPQLALLAHEVGHVVEHDFGLEAKLERAISQAKIASDERRGAWLAWRKELFADFYGNYTAGPQFAWALSEVLAANHQTIMDEIQVAPAWSSYPGTTLRMEWNACVLRLLGSRNDADELIRQWSQVYPHHEFTSFLPDLPILAAVLKDLLPEVLDYRHKEPRRKSPIDQQRIASRLLRAGSEFSIDIADLYDPRALVAAAGELSREGIGSREQWRRLRDRILISRPPGELGPGEFAEDSKPARARLDDALDDAIERKKGEALAAGLFASLEANN